MKALVIVASGLPAVYVGCYGNEWLPTPALDRLAAEGIVFDQHYADHPSPAGADRAWHTGCYSLPPKSGPEDRPAPDLFTVLSDRGVSTRLITDRNLALEEQAGWQSIRRLAPTADERAPADALLAAAEETLGELAGHENWLCKIETSLLHPPFQAPEEFQGLFRNQDANHAASDDEDDPALTSDSSPPETAEEDAILACQEEFGLAVAYLDSWLGALYDDLQSQQLLDQVVLLLTSDRGQPIPAPITTSPIVLVREECLHVPLMLRLPHRAEMGRRIAALTQPIDLLPTLFESFGLPLPAIHGHSLWPLIHGNKQAIRDYACAGIRQQGSAAWCLRTPEWSLLHETSATPGETPSLLYVKPDDRWEVNDVRQHHLDWTEHLEKVLLQFLEQARQAGPLIPPELGQPRQETGPAPTHATQGNDEGAKP